MTIDLLVIKDFLVALAAFITAMTVVFAFTKKYFDKFVTKITEPILSKIDKMDKNQCMNYLTEFLADVKNGVHKNQYQISRAHDVYKHYSEDLKGNSYIHEQWEHYMKGK